jgi:hypothetical protein
MDEYSETLEGLVEWRIHEVLQRPLIIMAMKALKKLIADTLEDFDESTKHSFFEKFL